MPEIVLYKSLLSITKGGVSLLAVGDYLEGMVKIAPQTNVQPAGFADGLGARTFDRGNRMHTITFTKWTVYDSVAAALVGQMLLTKTLAAGAEDVQLRVYGYDGYDTLFQATVAEWPSDIYQRIVRMSFTIVGGAISGTLTTGVTRTVTDEAGNVVTDEGGGSVKEG